MTKILLGLGSNLGDRCLLVTEAIRQIHAEIGSVKAISRLFESAALTQPGAALQPSYINAAVSVESGLDAVEILARVLRIELGLGRDRSSERGVWQARTIDIDILGMGSTVISSCELTIPHPELHRRMFVLAPLCDISPQWLHPLLNLTVQEMAALIACDSIKEIGAIPMEVLQPVQVP